MVARYTVIGWAGFIGARVTAHLRRQGCEVLTPARDAGLPAGDLGRVIYCAGLTGDYRTRPFDAVEAHVSALARLLAQDRHERIVYLSTTRLYGAAEGGAGDETAALRLEPANPDHLYECSKALGENLVLNQAGGRGVAARLSYVFDVDASASGFLSAWLAGARRGLPMTVESSPEDGRDYIWAADVVGALQRLADGPSPGLVNVASGRITTNAEVAKVLAGAGVAVRFTRDAPPPPMPQISVARLAALGVTPRPALEVIAAFAAGL